MSPSNPSISHLFRRRWKYLLYLLAAINLATLGFSVITGRLDSMVTAAITALIVGTTLYGNRLARQIQAAIEASQLAHEALAASESRFRAFSEGVPVLVCAVGGDGQTTYANQQWEMQTGEKTPNILRRGWMSLIVTGDRVRCRTLYEIAASQSAAFELDTRIQCRNGEERWFQVRGTPYNPGMTTAPSYLLSFDDITERKETEELVKVTIAENRELLSVLDQACVVSVADAGGRIIHVNESFARLSKFTHDELMGQDHRLIQSGDHPPEFWSDVDQTLSRGDTWQAEVRNRAKDGSDYWLYSTLKAIHGADGQVSKIISIGNDITPLKLALAELAEARNKALAATEAKSEFLANISHEIRTPMTAILGFTELLLDEVDERPDSAEILEKLRVVRRNSEHLLGLINDILDLSKIEAGKLIIKLEECPPFEIVDDIVNMMKARAAEKGLRIEVGESVLPEIIKTDPIRLRQILINLIGNAVKFTNTGAVRISAGFDGHDPSRIRIDVIDTGIGIASDQLNHIFEPFSQEDTSNARRYGGTGLGLTISRNIARFLGGDVTLVSSQIGVGSHFRLTIPIGTVSPVRQVPVSKYAVGSRTDATCRHPTTAASGSELSGLRFLLAEDSPDNQRLYSFILKRAGATVDVVENGELAVKEAMTAMTQDQPFDLIVMDVQMPVMDGIEAVRQLRRAGYDHPIIALTANAMSDARDKCLEAGFDDYLTKPIDRSLLLKNVSHWAAARQYQTAS